MAGKAQMNCSTNKPKPADKVRQSAGEEQETCTMTLTLNFMAMAGTLRGQERHGIFFFERQRSRFCLVWFPLFV
jgi:hypothetical protein